MFKFMKIFVSYVNREGGVKYKANMIIIIWDIN